MGRNKAPAVEDAATALHERARREQERVEKRKHGQLAKGDRRIEERSRSSDGHGVAEKQHDKP